VPGPPAVEGGRAAGPHTAMHVKERGVGHVGPGGDTALAAARLLAERDAEAVCRAAGPAVPLRVVAHDCPACGARAAGAAPRLTAQADRDADGDVATVEVLACEVVEPRG